MIIQPRIILEPSFLRKVGDQLIFPSLFREEGKIFLINPTLYTPSSTSITSSNELESAKTTVTSNLVLNASDYLGTTWESNGWVLANSGVEANTFIQNNIAPYESGGNEENLILYRIARQFSGTLYYILFCYPGNNEGISGEE